MKIKLTSRSAIFIIRSALDHDVIVFSLELKVKKIDSKISISISIFTLWTVVFTIAVNFSISYVIMTIIFCEYRVVLLTCCKNTLYWPVLTSYGVLGSVISKEKIKVCQTNIPITWSKTKEIPVHSLFIPSFVLYYDMNMFMVIS